MRRTGSLDTRITILEGSTLTNVDAFQNWDEFAALCVESPANVFTFDGSGVGAGTMLMPLGARVVLGENHTLAGGTTSGSLVWLANVDGPVFTGPFSLARMTIIQLNGGANARCLDLSTTMGRAGFVTEVQCIGGRVGVRAADVDAAAKIDTVIVSNADVGYEVHDGAYGSLVFTDCTAQSAVPGFIAFKVDAAATINGGILVSDAAIILTTGQFGFAIAHAATFVGDALMQVASAANSGPQANTFRQTSPGVVDMAIEDDRLVIKGSPSEPNWSAVGEAARIDTTDPLLVVFGAKDTDTPIPYEDGAGNLEIEAGTSDHVTWFKDAGDVNNSYFQYTGAIEGATLSMFSDIISDRASGTGLALTRWQRNAAPGYAGWVPIAGSENPFENTNSIKARAGTASFRGVNKDDRFRMVVQNNADTVTLRIQHIKLSVRVQA